LNRISHVVIGRGQPAGAVPKAASLTWRSARLAAFAAGRRFDVAVGHGSRALPPAARLAGVRNLTMFDYEHVSTWLFRHLCDRILVPRPVLTALNGHARSRPWVPFDGFKEEIYLADIQPEPRLRALLGVGEDEILAVVRPPSLTAHYHDRRSEKILAALTERLVAAPRTRTVWLPRDPGDLPPRMARSTFIIPRRPPDGPSLLATADIAISGGGTMNREAALLGTPAYTIFTGPEGVLDRELIRKGKLTAIRCPEDIDKIELTKKQAGPTARPADTTLREFVVHQIWDLARGPARARRRREAEAPASPAPSPERGG
jgi:uncharacterized protein